MSFFNNILKRFSLLNLIKECFNLFIGYIILPFSYCTPRNKKKWVLGNKNAFKDNTKYLFLYLLENRKDISPIWIASSRKLVRELKEYSYPVFYKYSFKGLYHSLTAGVYISTINSNQINYFTKGRAFNVYLWHGIALKSISDGKYSPKDQSVLSKICMPYAYEKIDFFLSTTPMIDEQFYNNFNVSKEALFSGVYPRCLFMLLDKDKLIQYIQSFESSLMLSILQKISLYNKVFVYMPTWRIRYGKKFLDYAMPDLNKLNDVLQKTNSLMLLKLHPAMQYDSFKYRDLNNIYYIDSSIDMYPLLPFTDVLISDYSSIYTDYLLLENKGVILYDFDLESYEKSEYRFFKDYKTYTPGKHVSDFQSLLLAIGSSESFVLSNEERNWILHEMWGNYKERDIDTLINTINIRAYSMK